MSMIIDVNSPDVYIYKLITGETIICEEVIEDSVIHSKFPSIVIAVKQQLGFQPYLQFMSDPCYIEDLVFNEAHIMFKGLADENVKTGYLEFIGHVKQQISGIKIVEPGGLNLH